MVCNASVILPGKKLSKGEGLWLESEEEYFLSSSEIVTPHISHTKICQRVIKINGF